MNKYLGLCLSILILNGCNEMSTSNPPNPKKIPYELEAHGDKRIDNYSVSYTHLRAHET